MRCVVACPNLAWRDIADRGFCVALRVKLRVALCVALCVVPVRQ